MAVGLFRDARWLLTKSEVADCSNLECQMVLGTFYRNFKRARYTSNSLWHSVHGSSGIDVIDNGWGAWSTPQTPLLWLASLKLTAEISDPNRSAFPRGTAQISKLPLSQELQRIDMILSHFHTSYPIRGTGPGRVFDCSLTQPSMFIAPFPSTHRYSIPIRIRISLDR